MSLFIAKDLRKQFGGLVATDNVSFTIEPTQIHALIGPNGAGKSTLVNLLSGLLKLDQGTLKLNDVDISHASASKRVKLGLSRCFQVTSIFPNYSVLDNLMLACQAHTRSSFRFFAPRIKDRKLRLRAIELASHVDLQEYLDVQTGSLAHALQRKLDVALALASSPTLLLLDEPLAGIGPDDSASMIALIKNLRKICSILLIEHDMQAVFELADTISVLANGRILTSGDAEHVKNHEQVRAVYLGEDHHPTTKEGEGI